MVKRRVLTTCVLLFFFTAKAGETGKEPHPIPCVRATATLAPGWSLNRSENFTYLAGELEYYTARNISVRGDAFLLLGMSPDLNSTYQFDFQVHHQVFFGAAWHPLSGAWDPFVAMQPGFSLTQVGYLAEQSFCDTCDPVIKHAETRQAISPLASLTMGVHYYFSDLFHFFLNTRFVGGSYLSDAPVNIPLNEWRISAGLGFHWQ